MSNAVGFLRSRVPDSEKITINLGFVDLGQVDLLVSEGFYATRSDFIRTAIRNQIERQHETLKRSVDHHRLELGLRHYTRFDLEEARAEGRHIHIHVVGMASIDDDVTAELALATIASVRVLGALHASPAVKTALAHRIR